MWPEKMLRDALRGGRRALQVRAGLEAVLLGSAAAALVTVMGVPGVAAAVLGGAAFAIAAMLAGRRWSDARVARHIESQHPIFQNLLVTAEEALSGRAVHPIVARELWAQAAERLSTIDRRRLAPLPVVRAVLALSSVAAVALLIARSPAALSTSVPQVGSAGAAESPQHSLSLRVTVTPPAYARRTATAFDNPMQVTALEGSRVRLEVATASGTPSVRLLEPGQEPRPFTAMGGSAVLELLATTSRVFLVAGAESSARQARVFQLRVQPDERPVIAIERPGRDLVFGAPSGSVPIRISARDDLNVADIRLRYTRITGSGETFTFEEGEVPLQVSPAGRSVAREASGTLVLDPLKLDDGDAVVYRALVRDDKPGADPVTSESFLIEIGKRSEASSTGFALPENRDRQGLSQQMLIVKTERLHQTRSSLPAGAVLEQSRLLAIEQRMVRAEFVFMTGGEVVDEVEEAEHSHELAAGRFENAGQFELLNAIREMSRAEARLTAGDTAQALVFERAALRALERAFDRRRYFLRTLPERARIDPSRRLSGDASAANPSRPPRAETPADAAARTLRDTMAALSTAIETQNGLDATLAARVVACDPLAPALQEAAVRLSADLPLPTRVDAAAQARRELMTLLGRRLAPASARRLRLDPLAGFYGSAARP